MSLNKIPSTGSIPAYKEVVILDQQAVTLFFRWNQRMRRWMMDIQDTQLNNIYNGIGLLPNYPLGHLATGKTPKMPPGLFFIADNLYKTDLTKVRPPDRLTFGADVNLVYSSAG